jgi:thiol-disulfide isomerase/thioredoxin
MRTTLLILFLGIVINGRAQNRKTTYTDATGNATTYVAHYSNVFRGTHQSVYNKAANSRRLVPMSATEFAQEQIRTAARIVQTKSITQAAPDFTATDLSGNTVSMHQLRGKIVVLNFWFVGCGTCEMEMPELNDLRTKYRSNSDVVFLSFVRSKPAVVASFLAEHPFAFPIAYLTSQQQEQFAIQGYPTNIVVDKTGKYAFISLGGGIGGIDLLDQAIAKASQ